MSFSCFKVFQIHGVFTWYRYEFHSGMKSNFVPRLHGSHFTGITRSFMLALVLTSQFGALLTIDRHALPVPVKSATHLVPERNHMIPVQNVVRFHTGMRTGVNSYRYDSYRYNISCYKWAPGWTRTGMKLVPISCKHPLSLLIRLMLVSVTKTQKIQQYVVWQLLKKMSILLTPLSRDSKLTIFWRCSRESRATSQCDVMV